MVVLHYTAMTSAAAALCTLSTPQTEVSSHYLIDEAGTTTQLVDEHMRAWHAGQGSWRGLEDINSRSIGIELANDGATPFSAAQMDATEELLRGIHARWQIAPEGVIAHSDMAPRRKIDPGPRFDWRRLARSGVSVWPEMADAEPDGFAQAARSFGYPDVPLDTLLSAFRLRFRPWADGPLDAVDAGLATNLAVRFGN
ncbi:MAG: N-acetylmuramoyl-L-alanine amidase [Pseudomonadota bacterium]